MRLSTRFALAHEYAQAFRSGTTTALEFEIQLISLGFYNVEFSPPAAAFDGVRYPLHHRTTELS